MVSTDDHAPAPPPMASSSHGATIDLTALIARARVALADVRSYKYLLVRCRGTDAQAQSVLDVFQGLLDTPELLSDTTARGGLIVATQRISAASGLYPVCYELKNITRTSQHPVTCGGFADIYREELPGGQVVCIKAIRLYEDSKINQVLKHYAREAILWGRLSHPNVLPFYGVFRFRSQPCLVAPWMKHGNINQYLRINPKAPRRRMANDVAQGLVYLHNHDIIHGDLKGPNILVDGDGNAYVADFGLSGISDPDILAWSSQSSGASKGGSVRWQAPELFDVESDQLVRNTKASDVYACACVWNEIFTGNIPYAEFPRDPAVTRQIMLGHQPTRPTEGSPAWTEWGLTEKIWLIMRDCWNQNPTKRPIIEVVTKRLSPEISQDTRRRGVFTSPAHFRERMTTPLNTETVSVVNGLLDDAIRMISRPQSGKESALSLTDPRFQLPALPSLVAPTRETDSPSLVDSDHGDNQFFPNGHSSPPSGVSGSEGGGIEVTAHPPLLNQNEQGTTVPKPVVDNSGGPPTDSGDATTGTANAISSLSLKRRAPYDDTTSTSKDSGHPIECGDGNRVRRVERKYKRGNQSAFKNQTRKQDSLNDNLERKSASSSLNPEPATSLAPLKLRTTRFFGRRVETASTSEGEELSKPLLPDWLKVPQGDAREPELDWVKVNGSEGWMRNGIVSTSPHGLKPGAIPIPARRLDFEGAQW